MILRTIYYRFTAFFAFLYLSFTVITGSFNHHVEGFPNALHVVNGVAEAVQITLQVPTISIVYVERSRDSHLRKGLIRGPFADRSSSSLT